MEKGIDSIKVKVKREEIDKEEQPKKTLGFFGRRRFDDSQGGSSRFGGSNQRLEPTADNGIASGLKPLAMTSSFSDRIIRACIYLLVFLIPLFFLPFTFEVFEFNKQFLLIGLAGFAFLIWLVKMIVFERKIKIQKTPLNLPIIIFLGVMAVSAIFSVDKISSIFGYYGRFNGSLLEVLSLGVLYFLIVNCHCEEPLERRRSNPEIRGQAKRSEGEVAPPRLQSARLLNCFLASSFFVIIISFLSFFGILAKILPSSVIASAPILASRSFNTVGGSLEVLSIYLVMVIVLVMGILIAQSSKLKTQNHSLKLKTFLKFLLLTSSIVLLIVINLPRLDFIKQFNDVTIQQFSNLPQEVVLDKKTAFEITENSIKAKPILGSGPATFAYDFSRFRPVEFNQSQYWTLRFDKAGSEVLERIATTGILGFISWLMICIIFMVKFVAGSIVRAKRGYGAEVQNGSTGPGGHYGANVIAIPLFLAWFVLFVFQFLYLSNTTLNFCFWMMMGMGVITQIKTSPQD